LESNNADPNRKNEMGLVPKDLLNINVNDNNEHQALELQSKERMSEV